jgi:thioredoxin 1
MKYGIMSIPTILYFKDGKLVDKTLGALPKAMLEARLAKLR